MSRGNEGGQSGPAESWHARPAAEVLEALETDSEGLTEAEAERRLEEYGPNKIREGSEISPLDIFISQFQDFLIYLLFFAAILSLAVGLLPGAEPNYVDAILILLILLANGIFGFVQDYRAEQSIEMLRELSSPDAMVVRDGQKRNIDATNVVPGDVIVIDQGDAIPADARLLEVTALETVESPLTGESTNVTKDTEPVDEETPLAERQNMLYRNTNAVRGRGRAVVVETGMDTEVGGIVTQIQEAEDSKTPFQEEIDELGQRIGLAVLGLIVLVGVVQFLFTQAGVIPIILTALTLAVAAVPEGLPAVVTLTLALGSRKMVEKNALVRRLPVVESLGSVDTIVTDKTGTLTENQMTVTRVLFGDEFYDVTGTGLETKGQFQQDEETVEPAVLEPVLRCGTICNNAERAPESDDDEYLGDPTEVALLVSASKAGVEPDQTRVREVPFASDRKRMSVVVEEDEDAYTAYMKGAPGTILERCDRILVDGEVQPLTDEKRAEVLDRNDEMAADALRVLGFARRTVDDPNLPEDELETGMVFLGLQGMIDPPRDEVYEAVQDCRNAGIEVIMVTGDNLETAKAIGAQIGFEPEGAMTGTEVADLTDEELRDVVERVEVFARVSPGQKVRITKALQANGHRVAMTGDGVNDAPGLRNADVGIAMGIRGTDVTQEASDMVLQDDNFVTIRDAIAEGRGIFDNIRKFVNLLLSANAGEVLVVFIGVLIGSAFFPQLFAAQSEALILTPVMLLWINLVTDGLPALALGIDPKSPDVLQREPRDKEESVIDGRLVLSVLTIGLSLTVAGLAVFFETLQTLEDLVMAQTLLFTFFVVAEMGIIQVIRRRFGQPLFSNRWLVWAVVSSLVLQLLVLYSPLNVFFDVHPLGATSWLWIGAALVAFLVLGTLLDAGSAKVLRE